MTATYHVARSMFCYIVGSKMALDHTADRGVAFCGLKNLSYSVAMYFSLRIIRTSLMREKHKEEHHGY